jgi:hypothetical protein
VGDGSLEEKPTGGKRKKMVGRSSKEEIRQRRRELSGDRSVYEIVNKVGVECVSMLEL